MSVALNKSRNIIVLSITFLIFIAVVIGQILSRMVVRPLSRLKKHGVIAEITAVSINSHDRKFYRSPKPLIPCSGSWN
jgi:hypothetical protein